MVTFTDLIKPKRPVYTSPPFGGPMMAVGQEPEIVVTGEKTNQPTSQAASTRSFADLLPPQPVPATQEEIDRTEPLSGLPKHKGMFGVKGTLRNVVGMLGDALLVGSGMKPIYSPIRRREEISDRMIGFNSENETDARTAISRVSAYDPEYGAELNKQLEDRLLRQAQLKDTQATTQASAEAKKAAIIEKFTTRFGQMLNGVKTDAERQAVLQVAGRQAAILGISLDDLGVTDGDMTPEEQQAFVAGATTVNQQNTLPLRERQLDISQQNADANTVRANREPQPRAAPNPTNASLAKGLLDKVARGEPLSTGQQEYLDRLGYGKDRGRRGSGRQSPTTTPSASTGKLVFRNGKLVPQ